jgi:hypothetical protein
MNTPTPTPHDDGLEWLRDIRHKMSAECNHDPRVFVEKMREYQQQFKGRLVRVRKVLEPVTAE